ncbi:MAG: hypoxanthine phosphoribosyltransferase, partial [Candidatus Lokiarchaeota archaeon]|nr:hypoxanthine phosphoribosyltransferase [Candidatus Lokiarchaeota archaeon]
KINKWLSSSIKDRDVLIIEDVVDTGITLEFLLERLKKEKPSSLKLCSLTSKVSRRKKVINIDYLGFDIPDKFIVGYGLDLNEKYRNLPEIYFLK